MTTFKLKAQKLTIPESYIEGLIFSYLKANGIMCWKNDSVGIYDTKRKIFRTNTNPNRIKGVADILGILPNGRLLAIEVKAQRGVVRPEQKAFIEAINLRGGLAIIARSVEDVRTNVIEVFKGVKSV